MLHHIIYYTLFCYCAAVFCEDGDLRIQGGLTPGSGRVEICYKEIWGTVWDTNWDNDDAGVACNQLGYAPIGEDTIL